MTQTLKKQQSNVSSSAEYYNKFYKSPQDLRPIVLNYLFRNITFVTRKEKIRALDLIEYREISNNIGVPVNLVHMFVSRFLVNLILLKTFLNNNQEIFNSKDQNRKVRIYLHKIHRVAPVFDYKRARENAKRLKMKLDQLFFWPQTMTQIAITIFVTDLLDKIKEQKIIQANLRSLCCCSAYAFHRTRNKIGLTSCYIKNL